MSRQKKEHFAVITPKTDIAKLKMAYHGERWLVRGIFPSVRFTREPGPWVRLMSRDGNKCLDVHQTKDQDFSIRFLD